VGSRAFTKRSVLFIVWDEDDFGSNLSCCHEPRVGGGHIALIAVTKEGRPVTNATPSNHFSLLATIDDGFNLPRLSRAKTAKTLFGAIPDDRNERVGSR
jgi:phosphatidylinositol-3-phosphatase